MLAETESNSDGVADSQCSDLETPVVNHELRDVSDEYLLSTTDEDASTDDDSYIISKKDEIFSGSTSDGVTTAITQQAFSVKKGEFTSIKQYDLGSHFDPKITSSMDKIDTLNKLVDSSPTACKTETSALSVHELRSSFKRRDVSPQYIDLVSKESISKKYQDWHFITENTEFGEPSPSSIFSGEGRAINNQYPTLESLLLSFGVSKETLDMLSTEQFPLTNNRQNDTLCELSPVDSMIEALLVYQKGAETFLRYFICFILDRKVYESIYCDTILCTRIYENYSVDEFYDEYISLVEPKDYYMHHRILKLVPAFQEPLIRRILFCAKELSGAEATDLLVKEFNNLFDKRLFQQLLYFVLSIYGSKYMPFGSSSATQYFKDCVEDLFNASASDVELSLLNGLLSMFIKIPS